MIRGFLTAWGVLAAAALGIGLVRADVLGTLGPSWSLSFVVTTALGVWACRVEPDNRAARRLLLAGCVALTWLAVSVELIVAARAGALPPALNLLAQMLGLAMVATQAAALVRYPDGVPLLPVERWLVAVLGGLAVVLPVLVQLTSPTVVPTWVLQWSARSDGLVVPVRDNPLHVGGPDLAGIDEALLGLGPLLAVAVLAARYRRLDAAQRPRLAWVVVAALVLVVGLVVNAIAEAGALPHLVGDGVLIACHVLLPVALGVGIAAPRALDALGAVRRTLPFAVVWLLVLGVYVVVAGLLGITLGGRNLQVAVVVAVVAAVVLEPVRRLVLARARALTHGPARLAEELGDRLAEIEASRQRLAAAEDSARRRLERDLHDGAQQDLAALLTRIALARAQLGRADVHKLDQTLATLQNDAAEAMRNLRELVSGIHETTLADQGLVAAVESRAEKLPIPVEVTCGPGVRDGRLAAAVESTAFFTVCEALANVLKHGGAGRARITMALDDGRLRIDVVDDGRGFDPDRVDGSTGLLGLRDRITAVGGTLEVRSAPGSGTTLTAVVPAVS